MFIDFFFPARALLYRYTGDYNYIRVVVNRKREAKVDRYTRSLWYFNRFISGFTSSFIYIRGRCIPGSSTHSDVHNVTFNPAGACASIPRELGILWANQMHIYTASAVGLKIAAHDSYSLYIILSKLSRTRFSSSLSITWCTQYVCIRILVIHLSRWNITTAIKLAAINKPSTQWVRNFISLYVESTHAYTYYKWFPVEKSSIR